MRRLTAVMGLARQARTRLGRGEGESPPLLPADRAYDLWAASYDAPPTRLQELEADARTGLLPDLTGLRVLDVGCGAGRLTRDMFARGAAVAVGLDLSLPMLDATRRRVPRGTAEEGAPPPLSARGPSWVGGDARALPFRDRAFDLISCALVLGHLADPSPALEEMTRVVAPGGRLLLSDFHPDATKRGWERTFQDLESGRTFRVEHHPHEVDEHRRTLDRLDFTVEALVEPRHDGTPVLFVLRAARRRGALVADRGRR